MEDHRRASRAPLLRPMKTITTIIIAISTTRARTIFSREEEDTAAYSVPRHLITIITWDQTISHSATQTANPVAAGHHLRAYGNWIIPVATSIIITTTIIPVGFPRPPWANTRVPVTPRNFPGRIPSISSRALHLLDIHPVLHLRVYRPHHQIQVIAVKEGAREKTTVSGCLLRS